MGYVNDAFDKLRSRLEITAGEQTFAAAKHKEIREVVRAAWDLEDDFLTGSYVRDTKTRRLKDVDIFCVIDPAGPQGAFRNQSPSAVLTALAIVLRKQYPPAVADEITTVIPFPYGDEEISFDVLPAFPRAEGGWDIPNTRTASWMATDPREHHKMTVAKNAASGGTWVPLVKMVKGINRELDDPVTPSFLLEVIALNRVRVPMVGYQDEVAWFLAALAEDLLDDWEDPAGIGPIVNAGVTPSERRAAADAMRRAQAVAEEAITLEDNGRERAAVEKWRELFGARMPRPE
jgi:hypothetical protein